MSTFLQLCQRVRQEAGISGSGPVTTANQSGEMGKIVAWVLSAYQDIQDRHDNWNFLRSDFSFPTIANVNAYLPTAVSLPELATWRKESIRLYSALADEVALVPMDWDTMRDYRLKGVIPTGRPGEFSISPSKELVLWPTPDAIYTVTGEYFQRAQTMTANADDPLIPSQHHMAIVWKAVMYYAGDQGASELYAVAEREYKRILHKLEQDCLPRMILGGALA